MSNLKLAQGNDCIPDRLHARRAARQAELRFFYALHRRYRPGDSECCAHPELGHQVTLVKNAIADYSDVEMHAALEVNIPNYANAMVTADEVVDSISALKSLGNSV
jgi:hypothetical protein